jgi:hypothetical protein
MKPPGQDQPGPEAMLDALLDGGPLPGGDQDGLQPVADVLAALRAPAAAAELTGQDRALAAFRAQPQRSARAPRPARAGHRRRHGRAGFGLRPRPALAFAAAGAALVAGLAAGAYAGDLPGPVQQWAHHTFGLTAARSTVPHRHHPKPTGSPPATPSHQHRHTTAQHSPAPPGPQHSHSAGHPASHHQDGWDGHQHGNQQRGPWPGSPGGQGDSPTPSPPATPEPSTSPAAQPSAQPSTSPHQHNSPSSPP